MWVDNISKIANNEDFAYPEAFWVLGIMYAEGYYYDKSIGKAKEFFEKGNLAVKRYECKLPYTDYNFKVLSPISQEEIISLSEKRTYHSKFFKAIKKNATSENNYTRSQANTNSVSPESSSSSGGCYVATCVYGSYDCPQVWTLRRFRDNTLAQNPFGRAFIKIYYAISPTAVKLFGNYNWFHKLFKQPLDRWVEKLNIKGVENTPYND